MNKMSRYIDVDEEIRKINEAISINEQGREEESLASYCLRLMTEALKKAPTADVEEVRHGKFIYEAKYGLFKCSVCGDLSVRTCYKYCHWCGAKMDGGKNDQVL